jgi:hypothetical protein
MKLKIRAIKDGNDKNRYCGPSVISAVTDLTTGEAARLIRMQTGRKMVKGAKPFEIKRALEACNIKVRPYHVYDENERHVRLGRKNGPTLAAWLKLSKTDRTSNRVFLLVAGWHWQLVSGRRYTCGRIRDIVSIKDKGIKRRARVADAYELFSDNVTKPDIDVSKPKDPNAALRSKTRRLAKKIGVELEVDAFGIWVSPPDNVSDDEDPLQDGHTAADWEEALAYVQVYEKFLGTRGKKQDPGAFLDKCEPLRRLFS